MKYKHDNPTHLAFGKSGDSKLLAKSRGYRMGGIVPLEAWKQGADEELAQYQQGKRDHADRQKQDELPQNRDKAVIQKGDERNDYGDPGSSATDDEDLRNETEREA